jgi:hypothetical protein
LRLVKEVPLSDCPCGAAALDVRSEYGDDNDAMIFLSVRNAGSQKANLTVLDAYAGEK